MRKNFCNKIVSIILIHTFVLSGLALAAPGPIKSSSADASIINPDKIVIPREFGLVKSKFTGTSDRLIVHIQDAHCNYEAQSNIAKILENLVKNYNVTFVSVEGADGAIDTSWFKAFPDEEVRKEVADYFMKKGEITGPEFLSITTDYPIKLFGAETRSYYIDNLNAFTSSYPLKADTEKYYNDIKSALNKLKGYIYNDELKSLDVKAADYESKSMQFNDYVRFLQDLAEKHKINLRAYENFFRLVSVLVYEKKIDFNVTDKERNTLIDDISKRISKDVLTELVSQSLSFKSGKISSAEYYSYLKNLAIKNGVDLAKDYPNLYNYTIYNSAYSRIENEKLFSDIKAVEIAIKEKVFQNDDQRTLEKLSRHIDILIGLVNIKLMNGDFDYYQAHKAEFSPEVFSDFIKSKTIQYGLAYEIDPPSDAVANSIPKLEDFYTIAIKRDKALIDNTLNAMDKEKQKVAVLITGGFHSEGMSKLLEKEKISYMVVCPTITKDVETPYIKILMNQRTPLEDILVGTAVAEETKKDSDSTLAAQLISQYVAMDPDQLKKIKGLYDPNNGRTTFDRIFEFKDEWVNITVDGINVGKIHIKGLAERMAEIGAGSYSLEDIKNEIVRQLKERCDELGFKQAQVNYLIQRVEKAIPGIKNQFELVFAARLKEAQEERDHHARAKGATPGANATSDSAAISYRPKSLEATAAFDAVIASFFVEKYLRTRKTSFIEYDHIVKGFKLVRIEGLLDALEKAGLPIEIHPGRGPEHNLLQAHIDAFFYDNLTEQERETVVRHESAHIDISNGKQSGKSSATYSKYIEALKASPDLNEEVFVDSLIGCDTTKIREKLARLLDLRQKAKDVVSKINLAPQTVTIGDLEAIVAVDETLMKGDVYTREILQSFVDSRQNIAERELAYTRDYLSHRAQLDAIGEIRDIPRREGAGYGAYIFVSSTKVNADYWQKRFMAGRGSVLPKDAIVISVSEENWQEPKGASNGFGTLNGWNQAVKAYKELYPELQAKKSLLDICKERGVIMMHMAGKATRMQTIAMDNKSAVKLPGMVFIDGKWESMTVGEAVIMNFALNVRPGRLTLAWGDQNNIPSTDISSPNTHIAEIFGVSVPIEGNEKNLPQYGLLEPTGTGKDIRQREKLPIEKIKAPAERVNRKDVDISLGFNSFKWELLEAALKEFEPELKNEGRSSDEQGRPMNLKTSLNIDSELWGPFTSTEEEYVAFMKGKGSKNIPEADWEKQVRQHWARVKKIFAHANDLSGEKYKVFDESGVGVMQAISYGMKGRTSEWWDWGMIDKYFDNFMLLLRTPKDRKDAWQTERIRRFFGLPTSDQWTATSELGTVIVNNSIVLGSSIKSGRIINSIVIGTTAEYLDAENSIIINGVVHKLTCKGHNAVTDFVSKPGEETVLEKDEILACHYLPEVGQLRMFESFANDIGKDYEKVIKIGAHPENPMSAKDASEKLKRIPVLQREVEKNRAIMPFRITQGFEDAKIIFAEEAKKAKSDDKILSTALENIRQWITDDKYKEYREVILRLLDLAKTDKNIAKPLYDSFWRQIPFGTGGRRWQVGVGPNRMNAFMAAMTFQGHYAYLMDQYRADIENGGAVAAAWDVRAFNRFFAETPSLQKYRETIEKYCPALAHLSSEDLSKIAALVYAGNGITYLHAAEMRSTPWVSFLINNYKRIKSELEKKAALSSTPATEKKRIDRLLAKLKNVKNIIAAIVDSSSHNPFDNNGTKFYEPSGAQAAPQIVQKLMDLGNAVEKINYFAEEAYFTEGLEAAFQKSVDSGKVVVLNAEDLSILDSFYIQNAIDEISSLYTSREWAELSPWFEKLLVSFNAINGTGITGVLKVLDELRFGMRSVKLDQAQKSGVLRSPGDVPTWEFTEGSGNIPNPEAEKTFNTAMQIGIVRTLNAVLTKSGELYGNTSVKSLIDEDGNMLDFASIETEYGKPFASAVEVLDHIKKTRAKFIRGVILNVDDRNENIIRAFSILNNICLLTDPDADRVGLGMMKIERKGDTITIRWLSANDNDESGIVLFRYRLERLLDMARNGTIMKYLKDRREYVNSRRLEYGKPLQAGDEYEIVMVNTVVSNPLEKKIAEVIGKEISDLTGGKVKVKAATHHVGFKFTGEIIDIINKGEFDGITGEVLKESDVNLNNAIYGMSSEEGEGSLIGDKGSIDKDSVVTSLGLAALAAEQLREGKTMYEYLMETYEKYGYSKAYLEPMVMTGDYGFRMINQDIMGYLRNIVLKNVKSGGKVQWGNFVLTKGKDHYDLIRPIMVKMGYGDDPAVWENMPEIKKKAQALIESVNILEFEARLVSEIEAGISADKQTRIVVVLRPSGTEPKHKNFVSVVDSQGLKSGESLNDYIDRINALNRQIMDEVMIECYKASKAEYPSQVTEYKGKETYKIADLSRYDLMELLKVFPIVVSCEAKLGVYFPLRDFIAEKGKELAAIESKDAYERMYGENRKIVQKYLVSFEKNNGVQFVEESVMMNLKRQVNELISINALNDNSIKVLYSQVILWFGREIGKNRFTELMNSTKRIEPAVIDRYIVEFSPTEKSKQSNPEDESSSIAMHSSGRHATSPGKYAVSANEALTMPPTLTLDFSISAIESLDKIASKTNMMLPGYLNMNPDQRDIVKNYYKGLCDNALELKDDDARGLQIMALQALAIITLIEQKIPGAEKLRLTTDFNDMLKGKDDKGNDRGSSYLSLKSVEASGLKASWRGVEGKSKLGPNGENILPGANYAENETELNKLIMYSMLHIGGFHTTVFTNNKLPKSIQHISTGKGHFQNRSLDVKYVVKGQMLQMLDIYDKAGNKVKTLAHLVKEGEWTVAIPGAVDYIIPLTETVIFNDISIPVPVNYIARFNPFFEGVEDITAELAAIEKAVSKKEQAGYGVVDLQGKPALVKIDQSAGNIEWFSGAVLDPLKMSGEDRFFVLANNSVAQNAIIENMAPQLNWSVTKKPTGAPDMVTSDDVASAAQAMRLKENLDRKVGIDVEPLLMTGEKGYTWGEPYEKSLNNSETGILGLMKNYLKDKFATLMKKLGITENSIIAERWIGAGLLNGILPQSVLQSLGVKFYGQKHFAEFGTKMLTAKHLTSSKQLSVQSHDFAEMIIAQEDGYAFIGLKQNIMKGEMLKVLLTGEIENIMNKVVLKKGDIYIIPAGTIHAYGAVNVFEVKAVTAEEDRAGTRSFYDRAKLEIKLKTELNKVADQKYAANMPLEEIQRQVMEWLNSEAGGLKYGYVKDLVRPSKDVLTMDQSKIEANIAAANLNALNPDDLKVTPLAISNHRGEETSGEKLELLSDTNGGFVVERFTLKGAYLGLISDQLASASPHTLFVNSGKVELTYANGIKEILDAGAEKLMPANIKQYRLVALGEEAIVYVQYKPLREERIVTTVLQATKNELKRLPLAGESKLEKKQFKIWAPRPLYKGHSKTEEEFMAQLSGGNVTIRPFDTMDDLTGFDPEKDVLVVPAGQLKDLLDTDPLKARLANARIIPLQQEYFDAISIDTHMRGYAREINEFGFILGDTTNKEIADPTSSRTQDILAIARVMTGNQKIDIQTIGAFLTANGDPNDRFKKLTDTLPLAMPIDHETDRALEENRREVLKSV